MNLQFYIEKLKASKAFRDFKKENPKAYFCSGFFTIDKEAQGDQRHLDFYIPDKKEMFSFKLDLDKGIEKVPVEMISDKVPGKLSENTDFDFEEIEKLLSGEIELQGIKNKLQKIIISLQNHEDKIGLFCTVFVSMLGLLRVNIDLETKRVTLFEKRSFFDMIKRVK
jgi:hypothetical protein